MISSLNNSHIQLLKKLLKSSKYRYKYKQIVLEGVHLLQEASKMNIIDKIYLTVNDLNNQKIADILSKIDKSKIFLISQKIANDISTLKNSSDLIFTLIYLSFNNVLPENEDCVALDRIQDPGNLGTILRSSLAANVKNIVLSKGCVDVYNSKVLRSAMGAHFYLKIFVDIDLLEFLSLFKGNINLTVVDGKNSLSLYECKLNQKSLWIFGNEGNGIDKNLIKKEYNKIYIPINSTVNSLNVAICVALCLFEQNRQRLLLN